MRILVATLQKQKSHAVVLARHSGHLRETSLTDAVGVARHMHTVVEAQSLGTMSERNAEVKRLRTFLGAGDRLLHVAEEDAAGGEHLNINKTKHLAGLDVGGHFDAMSRSAVVAIHRIVGLRDARNLSHHVARAPRRSAEVHVWVVAIQGSVWSNLVECLCVAADDSRLVNLTCHPCVEIAVLEQYELSFRTG